MEIFIDTADTKEIKDAADLGWVDGVTTNPSLVAKTGKPFRQLLDEIVAIVDGPISAEVLSLDYEGIVKEGRELAKIHKNIVVKVPLIPDGIKATKTFTGEGIKTNVTLCFSASQALLAAKAGATYISPFVGRVDDISWDGMQLIRDIREIYDNYDFDTKILTASARHPIHFMEAARIGSDVITAPYPVLLQLLKHPLTDIGLKKFIEDSQKIK